MDSVSRKQCSRCKESKPTNQFYKQKRSKDGLDHYCKECRNVFTYQYQSDHPEKIIEYRKKSYQKNLSAYLLRSKLYFQNNHKKAVEAVKKWCKRNPEKSHAYSKKYRQNNPQKSKEFARAWRKAHLDISRGYTRNYRARKKSGGGRITAAEWKAICDKYDNKCLVPGCDRTDITMDHVIPLSRGGTHTIDNVQPLCSHHNQSKQAKIIDYRIVIK